jgi:MFS family permease
MQDHIERLRKVGTGTGFVYTGLCLWVVSIVIEITVPFFAIGEIASQTRSNRNKPSAAAKQDPLGSGPATEAIQGTARAVLIAGMFVGLTGWLCDLRGKLMCLALPECHGAPYLIVSAAIAAISLMQEIWSVLGTLRIVSSSPAILGPAFVLFGLIANIFFMIFLRLLAQYVHRPDLAAYARNILILIAAMTVGAFGVLAMLLLAKMTPLLGMVGLFGFLVLFIMAIVWLVQYGGLLPKLQMALQNSAESLDREQLEFKPGLRE